MKKTEAAYASYRGMHQVRRQTQSQQIGEAVPSIEIVYGANS